MINDFLPTLPMVWTILIYSMITFVLTFLTTHHKDYNIMQIVMFDRKPFSCWLCSNNWMNLFITLNLAYLWSPLFLIYGTLMTIATDYIIYKDPY